MNVWIICYLLFNTLGLGVMLAQHGQPKKGNTSFWAGGFGWSISLFFLYKAGLFTLMGG